MTESLNTTTESTAPAPGQDQRSDHRDRRLYRALAWVGIVAGVVFTVAVIFFSGVALGRSNPGWHRGYQGGQMAPGGGCPMMQGGMMGPGMMGPGMMGPGMMDPEDRGPGMMRPPASPSPAPPPR